MPSYVLLTPAKEMKEWVDIVSWAPGFRSVLHCVSCGERRACMSGKLLREIACEVVVRPFEVTEVTGFCKRRLHTTEHSLHASPVFLVDCVQQLFQRRHVLPGQRIRDEL